MTTTTKFTTPAREYLNGADNPNALGTAIYHNNNTSPFHSEILAFVEGTTPLSLTNNSSIIYS